MPNINEFSIEAIARVRNWCNTLLRKILRYLNPNEAFEDQLKLLYNQNYYSLKLVQFSSILLCFSL